MKPHWTHTCTQCSRLIAKDGLFRESPMGGEEQQEWVSGTGCKVYAEGSDSPHVSDPEGYCAMNGCYYGDCVLPIVYRSAGWRHRDCGVAEFAGAPLAPSVSDAGRLQGTA